MHFFLMIWDPQACVNFYQELQKKITECFKRLTGKTHLTLWEGDPIVAEVLDLDKAIEKIAYIYANPARANLTETIGQYPGLSSWSEFTQIAPSLNASSSKRVPWIKFSTVPQLRSLNPSKHEDQRIAEELISKAKIEHTLNYHPNAWMAAFGIEDEKEIAEINNRIKERLKEKEELAEQKRREEKKPLFGADALRMQRIMRPHTPSKRERRIFVLSSIAELRIEYIARFKEFCQWCRECYSLLKQGGNPIWPPGALRPPAPPVASLIF